MNKKISLPIRELIAFFIMTALFVVGLVIVAKIPRASIREKVSDSAEFLCDSELFGCVLEDIESSKIDRYADSILIGIAYQYDSNKSLKSVMYSAYYFRKTHNENENLAAAVNENLPANRQYLRYWHGSILVVRPLLLFMSIKEIYFWNAVWLLVFIVILFVVFLKRQAYALSVGMIAGLIFTSAWFVPFSLEYTWTFLLMMIASLVAFNVAWHEKTKWYGTMFLCFGMITNFFDFLTTETLTLTVPLLIVLWTEGKKDSKKVTPRSVAINSVVSWGSGYAGAWIMKWVLASLVLHENVMPYVSGHITERLGGKTSENLSLLGYLTGALSRNIKCMLPFEFGVGGILFGIALIIFYLYIAYVYRCEKINREKIIIYLLIGCIPYLRFLVLHNHSFMHYFFTYRAQLGTILAGSLILSELKVWVTIRSRKVYKNAGKRKTKRT